MTRKYVRRKPGRSELIQKMLRVARIDSIGNERFLSKNQLKDLTLWVLTANDALKELHGGRNETTNTPE